MTPSAASPGASSGTPGTGASGLGIPEVTVVPGSTATTTLTVRNDSDIVEAYSLEVAGDCAPWTTVEPARVSLYPGTSETVEIRLAPPRSPEVRAGAVPLAVRVLPAEHPEAVRVPETTVHVEQFHELRTELVPRRRHGWLRGRYRLAVRNQGNAPVETGCTPGQAGDELKFAFSPARRTLEPGESADVRLLVRTGRPLWFGKAVTRPFTVDTAGYAPLTGPAAWLGAPVTDGGGTGGGSGSGSGSGSGAGSGSAGGASAATAGAAPVPAQRRAAELERTRLEESAFRPPLDGEFVQIPIFPRWLLAVLAALLALLLAWFALVRPAVRSTAKAAANKVVHPQPSPGEQGRQTPGTTGGASPGTQGSGTQAGTGGAGSGTGGGTGGSVPGALGGGVQSSQTIDVQASGGQTKTGTYLVPAGSDFGVTDIVVANFQGDEGLMTITFGDRKITTIALETFRNQDYHWVTPIDVPQNAAVTIEVTCQKPGTPATGKQAAGCHEILNVSGVLRTLATN